MSNEVDRKPHIIDRSKASNTGSGDEQLSRQTTDESVDSLRLTNKKTVTVGTVSMEPTGTDNAVGLNSPQGTKAILDSTQAARTAPMNPIETSSGQRPSKEAPVATPAQPGSAETNLRNLTPGGMTRNDGAPFAQPTSVPVDVTSRQVAAPQQLSKPVNDGVVARDGSSARPQVSDTPIAVKPSNSQSNFERNTAGAISSDAKGLTVQPTDRTQSQSVATSTQAGGTFQLDTNPNGHIKITKPAAEIPSNDASRNQQGAGELDKGAAVRGTQQESPGQSIPNTPAETVAARPTGANDSVGVNQSRTASGQQLEPTASPLKPNPASVENANLARSNSANNVESTNQPKLSGNQLDAQGRQNPAGPLDVQGRQSSAGGLVDAQGRQNPSGGSLDAGRQNFPSGSLEVQGKQNSPVTSLEAQGKQIPPQGALDSQGRQNTPSAANDALGQTRRETGLQLPETKQSTGRTETGGISNSDPTRQNTGRNDANTSKVDGKIPDAKTLTGLDQKFGDKLNPPGGRGDIPVVVPGVPDILGGLKGLVQKGDAKDGKGVTADVRDAKDPKGETKTPAADIKGDTKIGGTSTDDKNSIGQKGTRPETENTSKANDTKLGPDGRANNPEGKVGADGRPVDGRQQGGSNLVHDGGAIVAGEKSGVKQDAATDKGSVDGKTRVEPSGARVVDADGKLIGGRPDQSNTGRTDLTDKHIDGAGKVTPGSRSEGPFVLPPGSLPVPDLVGGIKNIGQQIDARTGKSVPVDDTSKGTGRQPDKIDPTKVDATKGDAKTGDGVATVVTGGVRTGDVKTVVTGGASTGDGVKNVVTSGVNAGDAKVADGKPVTGRNPLTDKSDTALVVPPAMVPLKEMIGNLKGIAERIFPPESRGVRSDVFDNSLPGRKTEKLPEKPEGDRIQSNANIRPESAIPIIRSIDGRISTGEDQFVIKLPQDKSAIETKTDKISAIPAKTDKTTETVGDANAGKATLRPWETKAVDALVVPGPKHDVVVHDVAAERLLVDLELVGSAESEQKSEAEEEEIFPLAAVEYFGGDFEKAISDEDEVAFDGDAASAAEEERTNRYQYVVESGDTIELIAIKTLNNVALAPLIYEINKDSIPIGMQDGRMVFTLKPGTIIWLPFPAEIKAYSNKLGEQMPNS